MVISSHTNWPRILKQIGPWYIAIILLSIVTAVLNFIDHPFKPVAVPDVTISLFGAALGILLGFRTNSAYDRWWEARKLWGQLVNSSRSLARQALAFTQAPPPGREDEARAFGERLVKLQIAFVHALRCHLRKEESFDDIAPWVDSEMLSALRQQKNVPAALLQWMGEESARAADRGLINEWRLQRLDDTYTDLANVQGASERIKNTPLPRQYDAYPELFVKTYCIILPLVLVDELKLYTPFAVAVISFAFLVLNRIGKNLEDPFDSKVYGTPMTSLSRTIEINLRQTLGETDVPPFWQAENGVMP